MQVPWIFCIIAVCEKHAPKQDSRLESRTEFSGFRANVSPLANYIQLYLSHYSIYSIIFSSHLSLFLRTPTKNSIVDCIEINLLYQWPFQDPKLEAPTIYKAEISGLSSHLHHIRTSPSCRRMLQQPLRPFPKIKVFSAHAQSQELTLPGSESTLSLWEGNAKSESVGFP
jgi:hypothetical protein